MLQAKRKPAAAGALPPYADGTVFSSSDRQRIVWHVLTAPALGALDTGALVAVRGVLGVVCAKFR